VTAGLAIDVPERFVTLQPVLAADDVVLQPGA